MHHYYVYIFITYCYYSSSYYCYYYVAGGPFNMAEMNKATVHASERVSARDMIQTQFEGDEDLSLMTDKDVAKMKKKAEKDERAARAALAAHQVRPSHFCMTIDTCLFAFQVVVLECNTRSSSVCSARRLAVHLCITSSFVRFQPRHFPLMQHSFYLIRSNDGNLASSSITLQTLLVLHTLCMALGS